MNAFKLLIDTNIAISLEDPTETSPIAAELVRLANKHSIPIFISPASYADIRRDRNLPRQSVTKSKLAKYQTLADLPQLSASDLAARYGRISSSNDHNDCILLQALDSKAVDILITQDRNLRKRAANSGLEGRALDLAEACELLKRTYESVEIRLPRISDKKVYQVDARDQIFDSLRKSYQDFDSWLDKCAGQHRDCWIIESENRINGIVIRKDERIEEAPIISKGTKALKICTFKLADDAQGGRLGELLLKQTLWHAHANKYDAIYLTTFPQQEKLIQLFETFGFLSTGKNSAGELILEKSLRPDLKDYENLLHSIQIARQLYPTYRDDNKITKYVVPIQSRWHLSLFPEADGRRQMTMLPETGDIAPHKDRQGNTIRKVYVCRSNINSIEAGSLILFYLSKDKSRMDSQSIVTIGVAEKMYAATSVEEVIAFTSRRSVFSDKDIASMEPSADHPVKLIDFLLVGHLATPISLNDLILKKVLKAQPQSIQKIEHDGYVLLKEKLAIRT
jgi:predicted nucleic acid-binding protein